MVISATPGLSGCAWFSIAMAQNYIAARLSKHNRLHDRFPAHSAPT
jgi:hypothetical protein